MYENLESLRSFAELPFSRPTSVHPMITTDKSEHLPETRLVIACAQTSLGPRALSDVADILGGSVDWDYIIRIANRNAVLPLISRNLLHHWSDLLPPEIRETLSLGHQQQVQRNMIATAGLLKLIDAFHSSNIAVLPFKGPVLAIRAHGDLSLRRYGDLDLLIHPADLARSIEMLKANGYSPLTSATWLQKTTWNISDKKDILFTSDKGDLPVELHWKLSGSHFALPLEEDRLWARAEETTIAGRNISTLSFNDLLLYLCLHGSRHSWERLGWISDINELIGSTDTIAWEQLTAEADRLGCRNVLGLGLYLVHDFFGGEFAIPNWERIKNDRMFREIAANVHSSLFADEATNWVIGDRYAYHLQLREKLTDRWKLHLHYLRWYLKIIFTPNRSDEGVFHLPRWLVSLYYVLRPTRLFYTYVIKSKSGKKRRVP